MDATALWRRVDELIDAAPSTAALHEHRLETLAVRRWRATGDPVPAASRSLARLNAVRHLAAPVVLERARALYAGPIVLLKGAEIAARYPEPAARGYCDLDLLVPDAEEAQAALVRGGFVEVDDPEVYRDIHHLRPLQYPGTPLLVELHMRPKWPDGLPAPSLGELFASARPSLVGVPGIEALAPAAHVLSVAAHAWTHGPLRRIRDLVDVAVLQAGCDAGEVDELAAAWGLARLWKTTSCAVAAVLGDGRRSFPLRTWAGSTAEARGRTVAEWHLEKWLAPWSLLPPGRALAASAAAVARDLRPERGERWSPKLRRVRRAVANASAARSDHVVEAR